MPPKKRADRMNWFKLDTGAFLAETTGLSPQHVGLYARLLAIYWTAQNTLPDNETRLKRLLGVCTDEDEAILLEVLDEFFPVNTTGKRCHVELDRQLQEALELSEAQRRKADARWAKTPTQPAEGPDF